MDVIVSRCAGLDVHKDTVMACVRTPSPAGGRRSTVRRFRTFTASLRELRDWLVAEGVTQVAMEATGVFWKPVWHVLDAVPGWELLLANAHAVKNLPGRKTDVGDAEWLAQLCECGLLRPSFVPPPVIAELRDLTRYRKKLIEERTRETQRIQKLLEDAGIKLDSVVSDILGVSARQMLEALIAGVRDLDALAELARTRMRPKIPQLRRALEGRFDTHHALMLRMHLDHVDQLSVAIERLDVEVDRVIRPFSEQLRRLITIPGVGRRTAEVIIAESGRRGALLRRAPLRTVHATRRRTRLKQAARACGWWCWHPAFAGLELALAGGVYQADSVPVRRAVLVMVDEVVGGDRPPDHAQPPAFPVPWGLGWLVGGEQVVTAERTATRLPGEQAQVVVVQRGFDPSPPGGPVVDQVGVVW